MADDGRVVKTERVEKIVEEPDTVLAYRSDAIGERVGESMPRQLDEVRAIALELIQPGHPNRRGKAHSMEHHEIGSRTNGENPEAKLGGPKVDE
jgi:hypothetical protein